MFGEVTITAQNIITLGAVIAAIVAIVKYYNKIYDLVKHQKTQDDEIKKVKVELDANRNELKKDIDAIKAEQSLMTYGVLACLKGLKEQGCDGPVTEAIDKIDKYLNKAAHGQLT